MRVTIKDIAERAGVSKTTVSFAFNDASKISKDTHDRIMAIAQELGYIPDPVARILTTKRIGTIGFLLPQAIHEALKNPYLFEILQGVGSMCHERDFSLTIVPPAKGCIADAVRKAAVDAFITLGVGPDTSILELLQRRRMPFVTIDGENSPDASNIGINNEEAAYKLMKYVLSLGHRKIAVIQVKAATLNLPEERFSLVLDSRVRGFDKALSEFNLSMYKNDVILYSAESSIEGGIEVAQKLLDSEEKPTAVVCMADIIALGIYSVCRERGLQIPSDLSVVGFDDIPQARLMTPSLTTVRQPGYEKGLEAAKLIADQFDGKPIRHVLLETELIIRESAKALGA